MKTLRRSLSDRVLLGVCGGLGEYFGVSGDLVRVIWIFLILFGGIGVIPYIAAVLLLPESDSAQVSEPRSRLGRNVGLALVLVGGWLFLFQLGLGPFGWGSFVIWPWKTVIPLLLVAAGAVFLWPQSRDALGLGSERKVRRSVSNRILAGVCGGMGERAGVDANLIRLAFVLGAVMTTGIAAVVYLALVVMLREEEVDAAAAPSPSPPPPPPAEGAPSAEPASTPADRPPAKPGPETGQEAPPTDR